MSDILIGKNCNERNLQVVELMSSAVRDLAEAEFVGRRDSQNNPLPAEPPQDRKGYAVREWTLQNVLSAGALLGKSCQGTLTLAGHNEEIRAQGYNFGKHLALAWQVNQTFFLHYFLFMVKIKKTEIVEFLVFSNAQACLDLSPFISRDPGTPFNLCSAPIMFHIEYNPSILSEIDKGLESVANVDYDKVCEDFEEFHEFL